MEEERLITLQTKFAQLNSVVGFIVFILLVERYLDGKESCSIAYILIMLGALLVEFIVRISKFFRSYKFIVGYRYVQIVMVTIVMIYNNEMYGRMVAYLFYMVLMIEFISNFDHSDILLLSLCYLFCLLPILLLQIYYAVTTDYIKSGLIPNSLLVLATYIIVISMWNYHGLAMDKLQQKYYAKCRFIEDAYAVNQQLIENQEKLKNSNEQLAYKKLQLESANRKINYVNSEIILQNKILNLISSQHDTERLLFMIAEVIRSNMGTEVVAIILYPAAVKGYEFSCNINTSYGMEYKQYLKSSVENGKFDEYIKKNETFVDNQVDASNYDFILDQEIGSILIQPITRNDELIGALYVADSSTEKFVDSIPFYEAAVSSIIIALDNANLYAKLEDMAIRDELTGIFNRRYLKEICEKYIYEALMNKTPLTVALFEIDRFKNINDSYGHLFGDEALKMVASVADEIATTYHGTAGRFGGEEFVVAFPNMNLAEAYKIVEYMQNKVRSTCLYHSGETVQVRLSTGVASFPETCLEPNALLNRADWAMYYSKENGRDRITIDSTSIHEKVKIK